MENYRINRYKIKLVREGSMKLDSVSNAADAIDILRRTGLQDAAEEYLYCLCLNVKGECIALHEVSHGDLSSASVNPREIYKRALLSNAAGVIIAHNHPSGDPTPSNEDISATRRVADAGRLIGIQLVDHIIVGSEEYRSLRAEGVIC